MKLSLHVNAVNLLSANAKVILGEYFSTHRQVQPRLYLYRPRLRLQYRPQLYQTSFYLPRFSLLTHIIFQVPLSILLAVFWCRVLDAAEMMPNNRFGLELCLN
jgi:hypothetical protein